MTTFPRREVARRNGPRPSITAAAVVLIGAACVGTGPTAIASQTIPTAPGGPVPVVAPTEAPTTTAASTTRAASTTAATTPPATATATTASANAAQAATTVKGASAAKAATTATVPTTRKGATTLKGTATTRPGTTVKASGASTRNAKGQWSPNGRPTGAAALFSPLPASTDKSMPSAASEADAFKAITTDGKPLFLLIVGSDARPGEKVERSRSDAVHLFAYNPTKKRGALIGFPRDTWVTPPGASARKLSGVLSTGGPDSLVQTMRTLTGLPISGYVITGFDGFTKMVDAIGGVNIRVSPSMNDKYSGAQFQEGWFQMNGEAALAFSRARKTLPKGDLSRSANQEKFLLATLGKLRETTTDVKSLSTWVATARRYTVSNVKPGDWLYFAQAARSVDPGALTSTVVPATPKNISGQSAVVIVQPAFGNLMKDLADGSVG